MSFSDLAHNKRLNGAILSLNSAHFRPFSYLDTCSDQLRHKHDVNSTHDARKGAFSATSHFLLVGDAFFRWWHGSRLKPLHPVSWPGPPRVPPVARQTAVLGGAFLGTGTIAACGRATRGLHFRYVPLRKRRDDLDPDTTRGWLSVRLATEILARSTAWDLILFDTFRRLPSAGKQAPDALSV